MIAGLMAALALAAAAATPAAPGSPAGSAAPPERMTLSVVGTSDLHGHIEALPAFGGYLANLRARRARDGGAVVLLDGGDMFQGTLASNLAEGVPVVKAYDALGYSAVTIGNHEFDFGPVGPVQTPRPGKHDDPRGALKARTAEARFPFLDGNLVDEATGAPPAWPNVHPSVLLDVAGLKVGIVGATTMSTPTTTLPANFAGLRVRALAPAIAQSAEALRRQGAAVVLVAAHAGAVCKKLDDPDDLSSCDDGEILRVARELPPGLVDAIVAGHTHDGVAHRVGGVSIIQSFADGRAFGRVDLTVERRPGSPARVVAARIFPPHRICSGDACAKESYEDASVVPDRTVAEAIAPALAEVRAVRERKVGVTVAAPLPRAYKRESPLGNLVADLMRAATPGADVAITNGGGVRADFPAGPLTYGDLFQTLPFDNRLTTIPIAAGELASAVAHNLQRDNGIVSLSGAQAVAHCQGGVLFVSLTGTDGRAIAPERRLTLVTSDFLATGGDGLFPAEVQGRAVVQGERPIRDAVADVLAHRTQPLRPDDRTLFDPAHPRLSYTGPRPVHCE